jgi:hypothetical protein
MRVDFAVFVLAMLAWLAGILILGHVKMGFDETSTHREAANEILSELGLHGAAVDAILVPKFDSSLDVFVNRDAYESVSYPDREELAAAVADIWCNQVSSDLLPVVSFRDVRTGSTFLSKRCLFLSSPELAGKYSGTVHNNTANLNALFEVRLVEAASNVRGCMQVEMPLIGTGPVNGTSIGRSVVLNLNASDVKITFNGTRVGHSITGHYTVTSNGQTGTFTLHQEVPRVDFGFNPGRCPQ